MSLPKPDPSLPSGASPLFQDVSAVRGDQLRANNGDIWDNLEYLDSDQGHGDVINAASAKTTPVDADMVGLMDSADGNKLKKLSWANIKATLKTYFDTLYVALTGNQSIAGIKTFTDTTDSTSKDTGSIITEGGIGCEKALYTGDEIYAGKGRKPTGAISGNGGTLNAAFDAIAPYIPNTNDEILITGAFESSTGAYYCLGKAVRSDANNIILYGMNMTTGTPGGQTITNGSSTTRDYYIAW